MSNITRIVVIDNFDSFTFNLVQMMECILAGYHPNFHPKENGEVVVVRNDVTLGALVDLDPTHLVISPGPGRPPEDVGVCCDAIRHFTGKIPILGICLGHQTIGHVFGADIVLAKEAVHGKARRIRFQGGRLFGQIASKQPLGTTAWVGRYHSLVVDPSTLPDCLNITAVTEFEGGDEVEIMAMEYGNNVIGLQFHPESIMTINGNHCKGDIYTGFGSSMLSAFLSLQ